MRAKSKKISLIKLEEIAIKAMSASQDFQDFISRRYAIEGRKPFGIVTKQSGSDKPVIVRAFLKLPSEEYLKQATYKTGLGEELVEFYECEVDRLTGSTTLKLLDVPSDKINAFDEVWRSYLLMPKFPS